MRNDGSDGRHDAWDGLFRCTDAGVLGGNLSASCGMDLHGISAAPDGGDSLFIVSGQLDGDVLCASDLFPCGVSQKTKDVK